MRARFQRLAFRWRARPRVVPVDCCVHYGAFRYGRGDENPYERYALALARGEPIGEARVRFADFLRHYRPRDFGAALGVTLSHTHPLWDFPWRRGGAEAPAWVDDPDDAPDILTHFSERGILGFRLDEEFLWAERLFYSFRRFGFQPAQFGGLIAVRTLVAADGSERHLVLDGNHRVSAIVALGVKDVTVHAVRQHVVRERELPRWPRVADGTYTPDDARRIFSAYFNGNAVTRTTEVPAPILMANAPSV